MATYALGRTRTASTGNPITFSYTVAAGDNVIVLLLKVDGATSRAGGDPTLSSIPFSGTATKAAASPEASAEGWCINNPPHGTFTVTIPNTGGLNIFTTVVIGRATPGATFALQSVSGTNGTSTNPTATGVNIRTPHNIIFSVVASGAQTWAPSAQSGTIIANTDDGTHGGGEQYSLDVAIGSVAPSWTFGTSEDWAIVTTTFQEIPPNAFENYHTPSSNSAGVISVGSIG